MKKIIYLIPLIILLNCSTKETLEKKVIIDPNSTSEMAQLMRDMSKELEGIKEKLENNDDLDQNLLNFALIHEQEVTDPSFQKPHIQPMSEA